MQNIEALKKAGFKVDPAFEGCTRISSPLVFGYVNSNFYKTINEVVPNIRIAEKENEVFSVVIAGTFSEDTPLPYRIFGSEALESIARGKARLAQLFEQNAAREKAFKDEVASVMAALEQGRFDAITPVKSCGGNCSSCQSGRTMKNPESRGPFSGAQIAERMMSICGCSGKYDCDCVSINNQAVQELYSEYNQRGKTTSTQ